MEKEKAPEVEKLSVERAYLQERLNTLVSEHPKVIQEYNYLMTVLHTPKKEEKE